MKNGTINVRTFNLKIFVSITCVVLYIVLYAGDMLHVILGENDVGFRYIPIGIVTIIVTFLLVLINSKNCTKEEEKEMIKKFFIAPIIVALIIIGYGIYSVHNNINKIKDTSLYRIYYSIDEQLVEEMVDKAQNDAIINWGITTLVYLISAEAVVLLTKNKVSTWTIDSSFNFAQTNDIERNTGKLPYESINSQNQIKQSYYGTNPNGMNLNGISPNGISPNGISPNGISPNAISPNINNSDIMNSNQINKSEM